MIDTNLTSAFLCSQAAYPHMLKRRRRQDHQYRLDDVDLRPSYATPYAASKGGIVQMTRALAAAWAKDNIQVNCHPARLDRHRSHRAAREQVAGSA